MTREMQIRNYSERTITSYLATLSKLSKYFNLSPDKVSIEQFKDFLHHLITNDNSSVSTINQTISAFKILRQDVLGMEWEGIKVKRPRRPRKLPEVLSTGEVSRMIALTKNLKHKSLLALAYSSGLRRNELRLLVPSDIDAERMQVHVKNGKGKKQRYTILSKKALELLRFYYKIEKPGTYLFETSLKQGSMYSLETINKIAKIAASRAGIKKRVSIHTLRHCFATHLLEKGVNLRIIQQFMGHSSIKTTAIYLHIANINPGSITSPLDEMDI